MNNTNRASLWQRLSEQQLVSGNLPATNPGTLWYLSLMQGFAGWLASLFMLGFIGSVFTWLFHYENEVILLTAGIALCTSAYVLQRNSQSSIFISQVALASSLCGQFMVAWSLFDYFDFKEIHAFLLLGLFQAFLAILMPNYLHRVLSSWFSAIAFSWLFHRLGFLGLDSAIVAVLFTLLCLNQDKLDRFSEIIEPITFGLAISLVQMSGQSLFGLDFIGFHRHTLSFPFQHYLPYLGIAIVFLSYVYLIFKILQHQPKGNAHSHKAMYWTLALLFGLASLPITGLTAALLVLITGFYLQHRTLAALGLISIISFFSWYYYSLHETLLIKSLWLMGFGLILLLILLVVRKLSVTTHKPCPAARPHSKQKWLGFATITLLLLVVNWDILKKEELLATGQEVRLELAPVDPRSLMQGDYMQLRFAVAQEAYQRHNGDLPNDGFMIVSPDKNQVFRFIRLSTANDVQGTELALQYRIRNNQMKFATNAFFFEEGTAEIYENAKYGMFKVSRGGEMLLHSLEDENGQTLGLNQP